MRLFVYGTLLDRTRLAGLIGRAPTPVPARLAGWRRVALPGGAYPTLRRARGHVDGAVIDVGATALARLGAYEGPLYRLVPVTVRTGRGPVSASAWIAPGGTVRRWDPPAARVAHP